MSGGVGCRTDSPAAEQEGARVGLAVVGTGCIDLRGVEEPFDTPLLGIDAYPAADTLAVGDSVVLVATGRVGGIVGMFSYDPLPDAQWKLSDPTPARLGAAPPDTTSPAPRRELTALARGRITVSVSARGVEQSIPITITGP